ncbi:uncharacterized protein N7483_005867 [Penicillium malachiteum]|uniref:uncharacterized protein n=1 Tax=Penicillium malachiteum TaxID=1324776 RepID=UPI002549BC1D|nr:uncharacterized protein N7483_005867 [Penicillium malachiteum]KAJ5731359.1 hypothetical protein N7483_005867 [Penicillium malachiteum]
MFSLETTSTTTADNIITDRMNLHHYLLREMHGYLVHPSIPTDNPNLRVADVGTGTGIWLTDLARQLPSTVSLDGLDISSEAAPPKEWLPKNMTLRRFDLMSEVPEDLTGVYDIVHIRLFAFVLKNDHMKTAMDNLLKLLKPGNYIQWSEPDILSWRVRTTTPDKKTEALTNLMTISQPRDERLKPTWIARLTDDFREHGLSSIDADFKDPSLEIIMPLHECNLLIHEFLARKAQSTEWAEWIKKILPEVLRETREGAAWDFTRVVVVGQKPL